MVKNHDYESWARFPKANPAQVETPRWQHTLTSFDTHNETVLPYGLGRSYGDSCLNNGGVIVDVTSLNRLIAFDRENGIVRCEAGLSIQDLLEIIVPAGWFVHVSPGTKYVTIGGAIANDVHGKNHHIAGTFGCHVTQFELLRSTGERLICSPDENTELFAATIGGLGLTGLITWAEFTLKRIPSAYVDVEDIQFDNIGDFFKLSQQFQHIPYTVSWLDCTARGDNLGRGVFQHGDFYDPPINDADAPPPSPIATVPFDLPELLINPLTIRAFNLLYYHKQIVPHRRSVVHYAPFFHPLDIVMDWYRIYGKSGFLQYQFVMPFADGHEAVTEVFRRIVRSGQGSPLVVFKTFGDIESPGMLSFPRPGVTLAIDFPMRGEKTFRLLDELDEIVMSHEDAALYPAKDARMSAETFRKSYPRWEEFSQYVDPKFSSTFWRRVTSDKNG